MTAEFWSAFGLGFLGSLHCIGMCGPIALALPRGAVSRKGLLLTRLLYNIGRVITYAFLGIIAGVIGKSIAMAGFQQVLSIAMGIAIIIAVLVPSRFLRKLVPGNLTEKILRRMKSTWSRFHGRRGFSGLFVIGILNGFLPCGLVYVAMAAAATTGGVASASIYMAVFGLGTIPVMFAVSVAGRLFDVRLRQFFNRLIPVGALVLAVLLILRGMSLGIPYISPNLDKMITTSEESCH